jgi:hypothetical protein
MARAWRAAQTADVVGRGARRVRRLGAPSLDRPSACRPRSDSPGLAGVRAATTPQRDAQALFGPAFVDKVRDIVGLYLAPPERALVHCVDEKSQIHRSTVRSHCCQCDQVSLSAVRTTTFAMVRTTTFAMGRRAPRARQLRDAQDAADSALAPEAAAIQAALHAHQRLLAESGGALVCLSRRGRRQLLRFPISATRREAARFAAAR